jgi:zinc transporter 9
VGIFCLSSAFSVMHGFDGLADPNPVEHLWASVTVIGISLGIESFSLLVACRNMAAGARARGVGFWEHFNSGLDPTSTAVVAEDSGAVAGLVIAGGCLLLTGATGNAVYDAIGSIAVGSLLAVIAAYLIQKNRRALVGRSLHPLKQERVLAALRADSVVTEVLDAKSEEVGPGLFRFKVEIEFAGDAVVERYLNASGRRDRLQAALAAAAEAKDGGAVDAALLEYGRGMVTAVGDEVDRLETTIMQLEPSIIHVDIETN